MPVLYCKTCGARMRAPDDAMGKKGRCRTCNTLVTIPAVDETPPSKIVDQLDEPPPLPIDDTLPPPLPKQIPDPFSAQASTTVKPSAASKPVPNQLEVSVRRRFIGSGCLLSLLVVIGISFLRTIHFYSTAGTRYSEPIPNNSAGTYVYRSDQERNSEYLQNVQRAHSGGEIEWLGPAASPEDENTRRNVEALARKNRANSDYLKSVRDRWAPAPVR